MRIFIVPLSLLYCIGSLFASSISGKVISEDGGTPIIGANIYIENTSFGTASNKDGEFFIKGLPEGEYILKVDYVGYSLKSNPKVIVLSGENLNLTIIMEESVYESSDTGT